MIEALGEAVRAAEQVFGKAKLAVSALVQSDAFDRHQHEAHGLAWLATYVDTLKALASYASKLSTQNKFGEIEQLLVKIACGEYLQQVAGGIPMNQTEFFRVENLGLDLKAIRACALHADGNTRETRASLIELMQEQQGELTFGNCSLDDTINDMRGTMQRFVAAKVTPHAHRWHLKNTYVPMEIIEELSELGVFALTLPEDFGGLGLPKEAMCVVSEELSRGWIAVGSLGTRAEIACELILCGGTEGQKAKWLPRIATGEILPTAVFTEPDTGSDLGSLKTRAVKVGDVYKVTGNKTWITHPVRADLMTLLVRSIAEEKGYRGLSMFLAEKPRGSDEIPFPAKGMSGSEIEVLGYRGMKEFEIRFEDFEVNAENLLGGVEGLGFKQLMQTFESARIQTAARAIGVAQNALDLGLKYALDRKQFGKPIIKFPRVSDKLALDGR